MGDGAAQPGVEQQQPVDRVGEVAAVQPDRGHPRHAQQVPGLGVRAEVEHAGAGDDLAADEVGELLADRGGRPGAGAVVVAGDPAGVRRAVRVDVQGDEQVGAGVVGERRPLGRRRVLVAAAGQVHRGAGRGQPALDPRGEVEDQVGLGGLARGPARVARRRGRGRRRSAGRSGAGRSRRSRRSAAAAAGGRRSPCGRAGAARAAWPGRRCRRRSARSRAGRRAARSRSRGRRCRRRRPAS